MMNKMSRWWCHHRLMTNESSLLVLDVTSWLFWWAAIEHDVTAHVCLEMLAFDWPFRVREWLMAARWKTDEESGSDDAVFDLNCSFNQGHVGRERGGLGAIHNFRFEIPSNWERVISVKIRGIHHHHCSSILHFKPMFIVYSYCF